jgi:hypothetical protein
MDRDHQVEDGVQILEGEKDSARRHARNSATVGYVRKAILFQDRFCLSAAAARAAVDDHRALAIAKFGQTLSHLGKRNVGRARVGLGCELPWRAHVNDQRPGLDFVVDNLGIPAATADAAPHERENYKNGDC